MTDNSSNVIINAPVSWAILLVGLVMIAIGLAGVHYANWVDRVREGQIADQARNFDRLEGRLEIVESQLYVINKLKEADNERSSK